MAKATGETVLWSLFAAGGVVAALVIPGLILVTGIALPFVSAEMFVGVPGLEAALKSPDRPLLFQMAFSWLGKLVLFVAISLPLFHCAHRIVHTSKDIGLKALYGPIRVICYGGALAAILVAVWVIWL